VFHPGTEDLTHHWLGGLQDPLGDEPDQGWEWLISELPIYLGDPWLPGAPNDGEPGERCTNCHGPVCLRCRDYDVVALVYNFDTGTPPLIGGLDDVDDQMVLQAIFQRDDTTGICYDYVTDYQRTYAWEVRYDSPRQRYLRRELDPNNLNADGDDEWSDYSGDRVYADFVLDAGAPGGAHSIRDYLMHDRFGQAHADSSTPGTWDGEAYYHTDQIGSNRMMTDGTPSTVRQYVYDAFGEVYSTTGSADTRYRYAGASGYESHDDFPFLHVGNRYYDPETGRFLQSDPIGIRDGQNVYAYVANQPTILVDPSGQWMGLAARAAKCGAKHVWRGGKWVLRKAAKPAARCTASVMRFCMRRVLNLYLRFAKPKPTTFKLPTPKIRPLRPPPAPIRPPRWLPPTDPSNWQPPINPN
jgi:RHS repeat-associated protein